MEFLRAVRNPRRSGRDGRGLLRFLGVLLCGVLAAAFALAQRNHLLALGYRIERLEREESLLLEERRRLCAEQETLLSSSRVEPIARERLELIRPPADRVVFVVEGKGR